MIRPDRRGAAHQAPSTSRIVVFDLGAAIERGAWASFEAEGVHVVPCPSSQVLLEEVLQHAPAVLVFALRADPAEDLGVLHLVRRVSPDLPIILLATEGSLATRKEVQELRPVYYEVCPIETAELRDAVGAALKRSPR